MSLADAIPELDAAIARLEQLDGLAERAAPAAARSLEAVARAQWAAGAGPDGQAWPKRGGVPLAGLTARITFTTEGATIVATGPDELAPHQRGSARLPARPTFPAGDVLPPAWSAPIEEAIRDEVERG